VGIVPLELRSAIASELAALVRGELPVMLTWVQRYGNRGAVLVDQPDEIWTHPRSDVTEILAGGWHVVLPLWTTEEAPSDLSAEVLIDNQRHATLLDVHVL
jgi:hypothetical protein